MRVLSLLWALPLVCLAGCGIGPVATGVSTPTQASAFKGSVRGGEAPIVYSKVSFYETATTGVATNGVYVPATPTTEIGSTYTDALGNFSFATPLHCNNSNDFVYAVAAGGNTGSYAGTLNANALEMAAVGECSGFGGSTFVVINEVSSVAAAYALSGFTSITGSYVTANGAGLNASPTLNFAGTSLTFTVANSLVSGQPITVTGCSVGFGASFNGSYTVQSATATQFTVTSSATGGDSNCVITPQVVTSVPVVSVTTTATNFGPANNTSPTSAGGLNHAFANAANLVTLGVANGTIAGQANTVVPSALINTIANSLQACVNSKGGTASSDTANDGSICGKLFSYTTDVSGTTPAVPANSLQAVLNMAHFPTQNVANIVGLASGTPSFSPSLTGTPPDLSIAIEYAAGYGANGSAGGFGNLLDITLDAADNVYVLNLSFGSGGAGSTNLIALSSSGQLRWTTPSGVPSGVGVTADEFGNVFTSTATSSSNIFTGVINEYLSDSGDLEQVAHVAPSGTFYQLLATNREGDLILTPTDSSLEVYTRSGSGPGTFPATASATVAGNSGFEHPLVAANGTIFFSKDNGAGTPILAGLPYTGTGANLYTAPAVAATGSDTGLGTTAFGLDGTGKLWVGVDTGIFPFTPTYSNGVLTGFTSGLAIPAATGNASTPYYQAISVDGGSRIWAGDTSNLVVNRYNGTAVHPSTITLTPCVVNKQAACTNLFEYPQSVLPDATGSIWVADNSAVFQIIGSGVPTFPLAAAETPGVMP